MFGPAPLPVTPLILNYSGQDARLDSAGFKQPPPRAPALSLKSSEPMKSWFGLRPLRDNTDGFSQWDSLNAMEDIQMNELEGRTAAPYGDSFEDDIGDRLDGNVQDMNLDGLAGSGGLGDPVYSGIAGVAADGVRPAAGPTADEIQAKDAEACLPILQRIADFSVQDWPSQLHTTIKWLLEEATETTNELFNCTMMCYFTDRAPMLPTFKLWVERTFVIEMHWPVPQVKFVGKCFYMVVFRNPEHRDFSLANAPWFLDHKFVFTFPWDPSFDIRNETYTLLPVWIKIPFQALVLEPCRRKLAASLGNILHYIQGDDLSSLA